MEMLCGFEILCKKSDVLCFEKNMVKLFLVMIYFNVCRMMFGLYHYF